MTGRLMAGIVLAGAWAGCNTVVVSSPGSLGGIKVNGAPNPADRVVMVANDGYFLFHCLPLVTGSMEWSPSERKLRNDMEFFTNHMTGEKMLDAMRRYADSMDCDLVDIVVNDKNVCPVGFLDITDIANTIIAYRSTTYSGVLCPRAKTAEGSIRK